MSVVGVGIDSVDVARFKAVLARRPRLAARLFTQGERDDAMMRRDPTERLAARFAAKEATMKALGTGIGGFAFKDVEVVAQGGAGAERRAPALKLNCAAATLADRRGVKRWHVSLTHTAQVATAVVVAETACDQS